MQTAASPRHTLRRGGFWAMPAGGTDKRRRTQWNRLVDQVRSSDHLTLYRAVEEGVPAFTVVLISRALSEPADMAGKGAAHKGGRWNHAGERVT
ncbi:hypothetical protein [uncultured Aquincola sp.]|uniref:hypothetical protein n=1 Tax=uncultured Aquincola sp. TaxID=886556 RepID=UPI0032B1423F